jgi:hypothetical protein
VTAPPERAGPNTKAPAKDQIKRQFRAAGELLAKIEDEPAPETKKRRGETEGEFLRQAILFSRLSQASRRSRQFMRAARKRFRFVRTIRLTPQAWGAPDAHLETTLNLFNQIGAGSTAQGAMNSRSELHSVSNHLSARL